MATLLLVASIVAAHHPQLAASVATVVAAAEVDAGEEDDVMGEQDRYWIWNYLEQVASFPVDAAHEVDELVRFQTPEAEIARDLFFVPFWNVRPNVLAGRSALEQIRKNQNLGWMNCPCMHAFVRIFKFIISIIILNEHG